MGSSNQMTIEEGTSQKKHRVLKLSIFAVILAAVVLAASLFVNLNCSVPFSPDWDGGKWSEPLLVNCNAPSIVEFKDKIYMFYSVITENTIGDDDVVAGPKEHVLFDVLYRVFDGTNFSEPVYLSSPTDKVSVRGSYFVFEDKLYAALSEWWIANYTSYETSSLIRMKVFDGDVWQEAPGPFVKNDNPLNMNYFVYGSEVWAVWQNVIRSGVFSNVFSVKTFDGNSGSATRNFTILAKKPGDWRSVVADGQLWFVWSNTSFYVDPVAQTRPHNDVLLGRFDGEDWSNVTVVSASDDTGGNWGFFLTKYQDELFAFWGGNYFDTSEHGEWVWVLRRLNLTDGSVSELTPVTPESGYKCSGGSTRVFDGRLYVLWYSAYPNWKSMIVAFNGSEWSSVCRFDRGYDADGLFVYDGKLWAYGTEESWMLNEAGWTYLRSYTRSG